MADNVMKSTHNPANYDKKTYELRKQQAAILAAEGLSNKNIASKLGLSRQTIDRYKLLRRSQPLSTERITVYLPVRTMLAVRQAAWDQHVRVSEIILDALKKAGY